MKERVVGRAAERCRMRAGVAAILSLLAAGCDASSTVSGKQLKQSAQNLGKGLKELLPENRMLAEDVMPGSCFQDGRFTVTGLCTLTVSERGILPRRALLRLQGQFPVTVRFIPEGEKESAIELKLAPGAPRDRIEVPVGVDGGKLELECPGSFQCIVDLIS